MKKSLINQKITLPDPEEVIEFLRESNAIEGVRDPKALDDALEAWQYAIENIGEFGYTYINNIHFELMNNLLYDAGEFRKVNVQVGGRLCPMAGMIHQLLIGWMSEFENDSLMEEGDLDAKDAWSKSVHVNYEFIHPHIDGNGRTGRILYNIHRLLLGLPIHVIHEGREQSEYYKWFQE